MWKYSNNKWKLIKTENSTKSFISIILYIGDSIVVSGGDMCIRKYDSKTLNLTGEYDCDSRIFCGIANNNHILFGGDNGIYVFFNY